MGSVLEDGQQAQLELAGLKRTLKWTNIQREQLLDRLDLLRLDNQRLQERVRTWNGSWQRPGNNRPCSSADSVAPRCAPHFLSHSALQRDTVI